MPYSFSTHLHNFAVWTAARAAQRGFTTSANIAKAIVASGLREDCVDEKIDWNEPVFDSYHQKWAARIIENIRQATGINCTYGRASKIIAIYIKTAVVLTNRGEGALAAFAHPPIDRILLKNLKMKHWVKAVPNWTDLEQNEYFLLIEHLRSFEITPFWKLEEFWMVGTVIDNHKLSNN
jgi:hypothetical protein